MSTDPMNVIEATTELAKAVPIYQDLAQPVVKQIGATLELVGRLVHVTVDGFVAIAEQSIKNITQRAAEKLKGVPLDQLQPPPRRIAVPLLQSAAVIDGDDNELRELFAALLASSIDKRTVKTVHPSFLATVQGLSADEARILRAFDPECGLTFPYHCNSIEEVAIEVGLKYPDMIEFYIENMRRMRLLVDQTTQEMDELKDREEDRRMLSRHDRTYGGMETVEEHLGAFPSGDLQLKLTTYGKQFVRACVLPK